MARPTLPPPYPTKDPADYSAFPGNISRFLWRLYVQRLTPGGRWFLLATAIFTLYGGASHQLQGYVLAAYAAALWAVAFVAFLLYRPRVTLTARCAPRVSAGQSLPVDVEITQLARGRGADLFVVPHHLPPGIDAVEPFGQTLPDMAKNDSVRLRVNLDCARRGAYTLRGFRVETAFPFNVLRARRTFEANTRLLVYPTFAALSRLTLPTGRRYQPGGVALASHLRESFEYLGNREYRDGDNVRDIDWRATARSDRPIVREWVEEYMLRVAVVLDTHVPAAATGATGAIPWWTLPFMKAEARQRHARDAFERAVSLAAAVSDYMARQDYLVDLFAAGPDLYHLTAGRSLAYLDQILDILACVEESPTQPFAVIEPQLAELMSRISTVICVLLDWDEPRRAFVHKLHRQGVAVKVILCRDARPTLDPAADSEALGPVPLITRADFERGIDDL